MQVVAEVFTALQTPDFVRQQAALFLPYAVTTLVVRIDDACVDQTVERNAALCMCGRGKDGQSGCADNLLFHLIPNRKSSRTGAPRIRRGSPDDARLA